MLLYIVIYRKLFKRLKQLLFMKTDGKKPPSESIAELLTESQKIIQRERHATESLKSFEFTRQTAIRTVSALQNATELYSEEIETIPDSDSPNNKDKHLYTVVESNGKIFIFHESDSEGSHLFCDYLKTKDELALFFNSVDIDEYVITNDMCGGHYQYGENPKGQSITVQFSVHEIINNVDIEILFSDGMWFTTMDNEELVGDIAETTRDEYLHKFQNELIKRNVNLLEVINSEKHGGVPSHSIGDVCKIPPEYLREDVILIYGFDPDKFKRFASPNKRGLYSLGALRNMVSYGKPITSQKLEEIYMVSNKS